LKPDFKITGRTVIHQLNFRRWPQIIEAAKEIGLQQISFLPADVSSHAFNRELIWDENRQHEILLSKNDLPDLKNMIDNLVIKNENDFNNKFIAESPEKIMEIYTYYAAFYGLNNFPYKRCNAPWVSTVIEADGNVRPCFFHKTFGNIHKNTLEEILNSKQAIRFRKTLDTTMNPTCMKCVCSLYLRPRERV